MLPHLRLPDEKAELFPLYRSFLADDRLHCPEKGLHRHEDGRHYRWFRHLTTMKTVVSEMNCAPHRRNPEKLVCHKRVGPRLCSEILDSPGVELFHIVTVQRFKATKRNRKMDEPPTS